MEKLKIVKMANYDDYVNYFKIEKIPGMNKIITELSHDLGFTKEEVRDVDLMYEEFEDEYIYLGNREVKIHIFSSPKYIHLVIDSMRRQKEIIDLIRKYCTLP